MLMDPKKHHRESQGEGVSLRWSKTVIACQINIKVKAKQTSISEKIHTIMLSFPTFTTTIKSNKKSKVQLIISIIK